MGPKFVAGHKKITKILQKNRKLLMLSLLFRANRSPKKEERVIDLETVVRNTVHILWVIEKISMTS